MAEYKLLILDETGSVKVIDPFPAPDDRAAWDRARHWTTAGFGVELWCGNHWVEPEHQAQVPG